MIRLQLDEGQTGNISIGIKRDTDPETHLANGKYRINAFYDGYRGDKEEIQKKLWGLSNEGDYPLSYEGESQHDQDSRNHYFARELVKMMDKVGELSRSSNLGLVVKDLDDGWNTGDRTIAGILEKQHGVKIVPEDRVDYEIRKPVGHFVEEPLKTS